MILQSPLDIFPSDGGLSTGDGALIDLVWLPKSQPNKLFERNKSNIGGERERERESTYFYTVWRNYPSVAFHDNCNTNQLVQQGPAQTFSSNACQADGI